MFRLILILTLAAIHVEHKRWKSLTQSTQGRNCQSFEERAAWPVMEEVQLHLHFACHDIRSVFFDRQFIYWSMAEGKLVRATLILDPKLLWSPKITLIPKKFPWFHKKIPWLPNNYFDSPLITFNPPKITLIPQGSVAISSIFLIPSAIASRSLEVISSIARFVAMRWKRWFWTIYLRISCRFFVPKMFLSVVWARSLNKTFQLENRERTLNLVKPNPRKQISIILPPPPVMQTIGASRNE